MKKILLILIVSILFGNTAGAYYYPHEFTKHTGKYTAVQDDSQMNLKGYLTPLLMSDDASVGIRSSGFSIQGAKYTTFLRNNGIYGINGILESEVFGNISNNPLGLFFENENDPMSIFQDDNLKVVSQGLPIYLNVNLYNTLKNKDTNELYAILNGTSYLSDTTAPGVQIKGKIRDFNVNYEVEICEYGIACAIELLPLKNKFIQSGFDEKPMTEDEFLEEFYKIMKSYKDESFEVNTKIFVAEEIIVNGVNIATIGNKYQSSTDYSSYNYIRNQNLHRLNEDKIKVLDRVVKAFRKVNATGNTKQVQDFMKQMKNVIESDFNKIKEIVEQYGQGTPDSYIVSQNPNLTKLRQRYMLLSAYYTILTPVSNEGLAKEKKQIEEKRALELKILLNDEKGGFNDPQSLIYGLFNQE